MLSLLWRKRSVSIQGADVPLYTDLIFYIGTNLKKTLIKFSVKYSIFSDMINPSGIPYNVDAAKRMEGNVKKIIEVKNLYKLYRVGDSIVRALNGVDFAIYEGEFCAIVGTSGSGKSTLLNMLAGLEKPTKGEVIIDGVHMETLNEEGLVRFRRENVGFIFQSFHLLGTMNALENVALPLSFRGESRASRLKKADQMLDLVKLKKHKKHLPSQMSGGQQQRVGVARALVVDPKIIFADEPTGNLDSHTSEEVMELMQQVVKKQGKTLVMVTHDDHLAAYADRIFHIIDGKIVKVEVNSAKEAKKENATKKEQTREQKKETKKEREREEE